MYYYWVESLCRRWWYRDGYERFYGSRKDRNHPFRIESWFGHSPASASPARCATVVQIVSSPVNLCFAFLTVLHSPDNCIRIDPCLPTLDVGCECNSSWCIPHVYFYSVWTHQVRRPEVNWGVLVISSCVCPFSGRRATIAPIRLDRPGWEVRRRCPLGALECSIFHRV